MASCRLPGKRKEPAEHGVRGAIADGKVSTAPDNMIKRIADIAKIRHFKVQRIYLKRTVPTENRKSGHTAEHFSVFLSHGIGIAQSRRRLPETDNYRVLIVCASSVFLMCRQNVVRVKHGSGAPTLLAESMKTLWSLSPARLPIQASLS